MNHNLKRITGRVRKHLRGFGFLIPDSPEIQNNIYIVADSLGDVMEGDRVAVRLVRGGNPSLGPRAEVSEIIERNQTHCLGRLTRKNDGQWWVARSKEDPDPDLLLGRSLRERLEPNTLVLARITRYPQHGHPPQGELVEALSEDDATNDVLRCSVAAGWPLEFSGETTQQAESLTWEPELPFWRRDCTHLPLVTIDGEDAKDFDDAVAAVEDPKGFIRVYVAIADVSHYVRIGSAVDADAFRRATSVYFPGTVSPMLPEELSNELCSLVPKQDREVLVCEMHYRKDGTRVKYEFYPGRMHSRRRCTYSEVETFHQTGELKDAGDDVKQSLRLLYQLYDQLKVARQKRGALDFDLPESRVYVDERGYPTMVLTTDRYDSHKLIEEWMIAANVAAGEFILEHHKSGVYRNHDFPEAKKAQTFLALAKAHFPRNCPSYDQLKQSPKNMQRFLHEIAQSPKKELFHMLALRSMPMAMYESNLKQHYGLGLPVYTHFTSPIRRYPDLMVHRLIKRGLRFLPEEERMHVTPQHVNLNGANLHCSQQERTAMELERKVSDIKKARFMEPLIGEAFVGKVGGCGMMGVFVRLEAFPIDGLIPMETLPRDDYRYDEHQQALLGRNPAHRFHLGDTIQVLCVQVNVDAGKINFELIYDSHH